MEWKMWSCSLFFTLAKYLLESKLLSLWLNGNNHNIYVHVVETGNYRCYHHQFTLFTFIWLWPLYSPAGDFQLIWLVWIAAHTCRLKSPQKVHLNKSNIEKENPHCSCRSLQKSPLVLTWPHLEFGLCLP